MALRGLKRGERRGSEDLTRVTTSKENNNNSSSDGGNGGVADSLNEVEGLPKDEEDLRVQPPSNYDVPHLLPTCLQPVVVQQPDDEDPAVVGQLERQLFAEFTSTTSTSIPEHQTAMTTGPVVAIQDKPVKSDLPVMSADLGHNLSVGVLPPAPLPKKKKRPPRPWSEEELNELKRGIEFYGKGRWRDILQNGSFLPCRSANDLKEKWWRMVLKDPSLQKDKDEKDIQQPIPGAVKRKQPRSSKPPGNTKRKYERKPKEISVSMEQKKNSVTV